MQTNDCALWGTCGGCPWGGRALDDQRRDKLSAVASLTPSSGRAAHFAETPGLRLRDRADLIWQRSAAPGGGDKMRLGLYGLNQREVVDLDACPMMSPALEAFLKDYRRRAPPIARGSVRLRIAPDGRRGVWLDFANQDVKTLFEERTYLRWLSDLAYVEIGQRRKRLIWRDEQPKLIDPELHPWFETYGPGGRAIPLYGPVGGFSQSGFVGNRALIDAVAEAVARSGVTSWLELFGGNGNFALALAARGHALEVVEVDRLAIDGIERARRDHPDLEVTTRRLDAYLKLDGLPSPLGRGVLVDPPRAGLRETLPWLARERPAALVYVSCFTDVFLEDARRLIEVGYHLESLVGVDQFAQSPHAEWVALFKF